MSETKPATGLQAEVERLRAENATLRQQIAASNRPAANPEPRFELSAGEQSDLQVHGVTRSARTGQAITAEDYRDEVDLEALSEAAKASIAAENARRAKAGK
jgi:hypothetical protein